MEIWDVYDINRIKTGTMERGDKFKDDAHTCVMHICIFNSKGEMLIQQRQKFKRTWPNMWDLSVGGHNVVGETPQESAERELFEELGIKKDFTGIRPHFTINFIHGFDDYFFLMQDIDLKDIKMQDEEVQAVRWASREEIKNMIDEGEFIGYYKSLIDLIFDSSTNYGAHANEPKEYLR